MRTLLFAFTAAVALPSISPASAQAPAQLDIETVQPIRGSWSYRAIAGGSEAAFADLAATRRLVVRCNRAARTVSVGRTGIAQAAPTLAIWTSTASRSVPSRFLPTGELVADIAANDTLLDAIAFSRGRFATGAAGAPMVAVPVWPEVSRVIEDCRS